MRDRREIRGTGVSDARRLAVMAAYNYTCVTCGVVGYEKKRPKHCGKWRSFPTDEPGNSLSIDHVKPWSNDDLAVLCQRCNAQKSDRDPVYDLVRAYLDMAVHLRPTGGDFPTLCYATAAQRLGGWPAPRPPRRWQRDEPRPSRICRRCWVAATAVSPTSANTNKPAATPTADLGAR